jgi:hypothetical protein
MRSCAGFVKLYLRELLVRDAHFKLELLYLDSKI